MSIFRRKEYETRGQKTLDFFIGAGIFIVMNILMFIAFNALSTGLTATNTEPGQTLAVAAGCLPFFVNVVVMVAFALTRHWIALGMLGTIAFLLALALAVGVIAGVACLVILAAGGFR